MVRPSRKREKLIDAANDLIYKQGFRQTTLADIARASGVPLGNVYYYFKTKDALGEAVIDARLDDFRTRCETWEKFKDPRDRLLGFLEMPLELRNLLAERGCPVGSLCQELHKEHNALTSQADSVLRAHIDWTTEQFRAMGKPDPETLGIHLIASLQGVSLLASTLGDASVIDQEIKRLREWIKEL